jgi:methionyl-tRNA synthetase
LIGTERLYEEDPDKSLNLPTDVPANEFMNLAGAQFSKSRGHMITLPDLLSRYDADALRYYVAAIMPETSDSDFYWDDFVQRNNGELVGIWGNLSHRVLSFTYKYFGEIPEQGALDEVDEKLLTRAESAFELVGAHLEARRFRAALSEAMDLARAGNRYLEVKAPWQQIKEDRAAAGTTLNVVLQVINALKTLLAPFLPFASERLNRTLGYSTPIFGDQVIQAVGAGDDTHEVLTYEPNVSGNTWAFEELPAGRTLDKPTPLFRKLDTEIIEEELKRMDA